jgi:hypothetical protein
MQLHSTQLTGLLGAIMLSSGLASSLSMAQEPEEKQAESTLTQQVENQLTESRDDSTESRQSSDSKRSDEMVEVRISMPDGRTIIRRERAQHASTRHSFPSSGSSSRILADGSRISYARGGISGGSNASSSRSGSARPGGGSSSSAFSGGGGGSSALTKSGGALAGTSSEGTKSNVESASPADSSAQSSASGRFAGSVASTFTGSSSSTPGSSGFTSSSFSVSSSGSAGGSASVETSGSSSGSTSSGHAAPPRSVHTVGGARYSQDGATGGQRVEFHDAGMGAAVIGNSVFFIGVELVQANQSFQVITGTRVGADSAIMEDRRLPGGSNPLSSWNVGASTLRLDFVSGSLVDLVMYSQSADASHPDRVERTWTVQIR